MSAAPSLRVEREMLRAHGIRWLASVDEVGRGALGGPVSVGVVLVDLDTRSAPSGVRDSKLLTPAARERMVPKLQRWAPSWAVAHASAAEIDALGILRALRLAGERAFAQLPVRPDHVLLDGSYDWISRPAPALFDEDGAVADLDAVVDPPPVTMRIKADMTCSSVAAASVLAKTTRDAIMVGLATEHPEYGWEINKGYASPEHLDALRRLGPCVQHRRSWAIPGGDRDVLLLDVEAADDALAHG
ncbi:ribonuclease HII [Longivirga aurantiaca]|uniref:Ribonuclease HII n=1 Tax=Longivirga aurantiaca TaxID=1837743 RepID=A0ABW1SZM7_9ACTN